MHSEPLDILPLWLFFVVSTALGLLAMEGGFRLGKNSQSLLPMEKEGPVGAMVGSMLGLLAIILAFTFNLGASRFDTRRLAVLEEANAIGTTYLRARLLPEPNQSIICNLLKEYVNVRIRMVQDGTIPDGLKTTALLHEKLWQQVIIVTNNSSSPFMAGLFMQSLNQVIDMHGKRVFVGLHNRIPFTIWMALIVLELIGMVGMGYQAGLSATRRSPMMLLLAIAFSSILFLIVDLDRSQEGFLRVSQQALVDLQQLFQGTAL
jgi:hypothetical protein